jgi:drug/metabolite transporter (DMT)-like permease
MEHRRLSGPAIDPGMLLVALIWGANFVIVKAAFAEIPPLAFAAVRFTIASIALALLLRWREGLGPWPAGQSWRLVGLGFVGHTLYQTLFVLGLARTTAANSAMLLSTTPALVALFGASLGIERVSRRAAGGIALAMLGIALVMTPRGAGFSMRTLSGDALTLASVVCWASYVLGVRKMGERFSALRLTTLSMLTGTPGLLLLGAPQLDFSTVGWRAWGGILYSAFFALVIGYLLYHRAVQRIGSVQTSIHGCIIPIIASLIAWAALGEQPTLRQGLGAALIISGVLLTRRPGPARVSSFEAAAAE